MPLFPKITTGVATSLETLASIGVDNKNYIGISIRRGGISAGVRPEGRNQCGPRGTRTRTYPLLAEWTWLPRTELHGPQGSPRSLQVLPGFRPTALTSPLSRAKACNTVWVDGHMEGNARGSKEENFQKGRKGWQSSKAKRGQGRKQDGDGGSQVVTAQRPAPPLPRSPTRIRGAPATGPDTKEARVYSCRPRLKRRRLVRPPRPPPFGCSCQVGIQKCCQNGFFRAIWL